VLALVQRDEFVSLLKDEVLTPKFRNEIRDALLLELNAFTRAVEVDQTTGKPEETKSWWESGWAALLR
jgi:hypothetical protein